MMRVAPKAKITAPRRMIKPEINKVVYIDESLNEMVVGVEVRGVVPGTVMMSVGMGSVNTGVTLRCWQSLTSRLTVRSSANLSLS